MNYKKSVREYIAANSDKFEDTEAFRAEVRKMIVELNEYPKENKHEMSFFKSILKEMMTRDEAVEILEKSFAVRARLNYYGKIVPAWNVARVHSEKGYTVIDNDDFVKDSFTLVEWSYNSDSEAVFSVHFSLPYKDVEKFSKTVKYHMKKLGIRI